MSEKELFRTFQSTTRWWSCSGGHLVMWSNASVLKVLRWRPSRLIEVPWSSSATERWRGHPGTAVVFGSCRILKWNGSFTYQDHICISFELSDQDLCKYVGKRYPHFRDYNSHSAGGYCPAASELIPNADRSENIMLVDRRQKLLSVRLIDFSLAL